MALFITFEGIEGCGKSTQSRLLKRKLDRLSIPVIITHEPGVTSLGKRVNQLLKWSRNVEITPIAELLLFNVSRAQLIKEVIRPALADGITVICDRYSDSTTAYQGYGRGIDMETVQQANDMGMQDVKPDITLLLDMPVEAGMDRKAGDKPDRFEKESIEFHKKVRQGYLSLASAEPERWVVINALQDRQSVTREIWNAISRHFE